jgi:hypothetical protein
MPWAMDMQRVRLDAPLGVARPRGCPRMCVGTNRDPSEGIDSWSLGRSRTEVAGHDFEAAIAWSRGTISGTAAEGLAGRQHGLTGRPHSAYPQASSQAGQPLSFSLLPLAQPNSMPCGPLPPCRLGSARGFTIANGAARPIVSPHAHASLTLPHTPSPSPSVPPLPSPCPFRRFDSSQIHSPSPFLTTHPSSCIACPPALPDQHPSLAHPPSLPLHPSSKYQPKHGGSHPCPSPCP